MVRGDPDFNEMEESDSGSDEEPAPKARGRKPAVTSKPRRAPKRPAGLVNLRSLIDEGLLTPADDVLTVEYKGTITHASLAPDGRIRWKEMFFESPSAFSIYLKRLVNPARKADDGWKTVKYAGKFLEQYKMELLVRRYGGETSSSALDTAAAPLPPPPKKPRTSAAAAAADSSGAAGAPILKQLAPRGRGRSNAAGSSSKGAAAAAAGTGNNSTSVGGSAAGGGGGSSSNKLTDHTPRPQDLGSMLAAEHDYAPREGELVGLGDSDEPIIEPGRHFMSGVQLEALSNGMCTHDNIHRDSTYTPSHTTSAPDQQQQQQSEGCTAASRRPRRVIRAPERLINSQIGGYGVAADRDDHDMVRCDGYAAAAAPGSGLPGAQPFKVHVTPLAEVMMDFHAHLDRHEIIGLLAGAWLPEQRLLRVERAFPVREAIASGAANDGINVEMDPEDQFKVTEVIQELYGLEVVGWYHSHPSFPALPSVIDIANQLQMQQQFRQAPSGDEPYIAAIVSPYDERLPGKQSSVTWFRVEGKGNGAAAGGPIGLNVLEQGYVPMELQTERLLRQSTPHSLLRLLAALRITAQRYITKRSAPNLAMPWRPPAAAAAAEGDGLAGTRMGKLLGSVKEWWPKRYQSSLESQQFLDGLKAVLMDVRQSAGLPPIDTDSRGEATSTLAPPAAAAAAPPPQLSAAAAAVTAAFRQAPAPQQQQQQTSPPLPMHQPKQPFATSLFKALAGGKSAATATGGSSSSAGPAAAARPRSRTPTPPPVADAAAPETAAACEAAAVGDSAEQTQQQQQQLGHHDQQQQPEPPAEAATAAAPALVAAEGEEEEATDAETEDEPLEDMAAAAAATNDHEQNDVAAAAAVPEAAASELPALAAAAAGEGGDLAHAAGGDDNDDDDAATEDAEES